MEETSLPLKMKIVVIGGANVGKTSIIRYYVSKQTATTTKPTVQLAFSKKVETILDQTIEMHICDTAGQEKFQSVCPNFYRDSQAAMIVFDVTSRESFEKVTFWLDELSAIMGDKFTKLIVGNKVDLDKERVVSNDEGTEFAQSRGLKIMETSAKTGMGIPESFAELCRLFLEKTGDQVVEPEPPTPTPVKKSGCC